MNGIKVNIKEFTLILLNFGNFFFFFQKLQNQKFLKVFYFAHNFLNIQAFMKFICFLIKCTKTQCYKIMPLIGISFQKFLPFLKL